ncbi:MAG: TolC family protein [Spirochaetaceae bacterium]|nr:TolC family protein [Spirochaetaceae bacterium]
MKHFFTALVCALLVFCSFPLPAEEPLRLSLQSAVLSALESNPSLRAQRYGTLAAEASEDEAYAEYLPTLNAQAQASRINQDSNSYDAAEASAGVNERLPTGTALSADARMGRSRDTLTGTLNDPYVGLDLRLTQSLLKGGIDLGANLARIRRARLSAFASREELKGFTETLVYNVETAYWDYYLKGKQLEIYRESLRLSEENLSNTRQRINVGTLPEIDLVAAQAEVARQQKALIGAEGDAEASRLRLLQLVNPAGKKPSDAAFWDVVIELADSPAEPDFNLDTVASHVELGLKLRPDLAQARTELERRELDVVQTGNGMLPRLDVFIALGATGYAESFAKAAGKLFDERTRLTGGVAFTWPIGSVAERARARRSEYSQMQQEEAVRNMELNVELDVRTAYVAVQRSRASIAASAEAARLQEENLRAETQKYNVGRSTSFNVAQAQRDFLEARLAEVRSVVEYLTAILDLYKREGTLLERRGVQTEG